MEQIYQRLGSQATVKDLLDLDHKVTLQNGPYQDDSKKKLTLPELDEEPDKTTEWGDE